MAYATPVWVGLRKAEKSSHGTIADYDAAPQHAAATGAVAQGWSGIPDREGQGSPAGGDPRAAAIP